MLSQIDVATRSIRFIFRVDDPGEGAILGKRLQLRPGMFCRVTIPGRIQESVIVIPRRALREGNRVFVACPAEEGQLKDTSNFVGARLKSRQLVLSRITPEQVVIESGLNEGEILVLSSLPRGVPGMKVRLRNE